MPTIAITGGTGFVGSYISRMAADQGFDVVRLARGRRPKGSLGRFVPGDVVPGRGLAEAFSGADVVVHAVAIPQEHGRENFHNVIIKGTENVVTAAKEAGVKHLINIGALGAMPDPDFPFLFAKWQADQLVIGSGIPYSILRPSLLFGLGDGFFSLLVKMVRLNLVVPVPGDGKTQFQPMSVEDLSTIAVLLSGNPPTNRVFELGGPDHLSYDQILDVVIAALGVWRKKVHVPIPAMIPGVFLMERVLPNPPVTLQQLKLLQKDNITRPDAVLSTFGFAPQTFAANATYLSGG